MDANALADRLFQAATGTLELYAIYLGERLGLYRALASGEAVTSGELAARTGTAERYAREWLEHQAAAKLVEVDDLSVDALARRYRLPAEHVPVLVDEDDLRYSIPASIDLVRVSRRLAALVDAYRDGSAPPPIPWEPEGRAHTNRAKFINLLGSQWLPAVPDIDTRLRADPPARVADLACGLGWSTIAMAQAYPKIVIDGLDLDENAVTAAQRHAEQTGLADRVRFSATDAALLPPETRYDLVTIFERLHDMSQPVATLRRYATEAGFTEVRTLPIYTDYWQFYQLLR